MSLRARFSILDRVPRLLTRWLPARLSLRSHLLALVVVTLVPVLVFSVALVVALARHEREAVERGSRETARALSVAVDQQIEGAIAALYVNQGNDTGGPPGTFNQAGARLGVLSPGTYHFEYELESTDRDNDQAGSGTATGHVRLVLRKPLAPTEFEAATTGRTVRLSWRASRDATSYHLEAGSAPGLSNLAVFNTGSTALSQAVGGVPPGVYYVRIRAVNALGASVVSNERMITVS